jgi:hypothetical protein
MQFEACPTHLRAFDSGCWNLKVLLDALSRQCHQSLTNLLGGQNDSGVLQHVCCPALSVHSNSIGPLKGPCFLHEKLTQLPMKGALTLDAELVCTKSGKTAFTVQSKPSVAQIPSQHKETAYCHIKAAIT